MKAKFIYESLGDILKGKDYVQIYKELFNEELPEKISIKISGLNSYNDSSWKILKNNLDLDNFKCEQIDNVYSKISGNTLKIIKFLKEYKRIGDDLVLYLIKNSLIKNN